jgi:hypothetical protein
MTSRRPVWVAFVAAFALAQAPPSDAQGGRPKLPAGRDPGGIAVALIAATGIDYTVPAIARRLARDGEGDLIGLNTIAGDNRPFAQGALAEASNTALQTLATNETLRIVPIQFDPARTETLVKALRFAMASPARIIALSVPDRSSAMTAVLQDFARHNPAWLVIAPSGPDDLPRTSAASMTAVALAANVLIVDARGGQEPPRPPGIAHVTITLVTTNHRQDGPTERTAHWPAELMASIHRCPLELPEVAPAAFTQLLNLVSPRPSQSRHTNCARISVHQHDALNIAR